VVFAEHLLLEHKSSAKARIVWHSARQLNLQLHTSISVRARSWLGRGLAPCSVGAAYLVLPVVRQNSATGTGKVICDFVSRIKTVTIWRFEITTFANSEMLSQLGHSDI
jgi:hypothetical protein